MTFKVILAAAVLATSFTSFSSSAAYSADESKPAAAGNLTTGEKGRKISGKPDGTYGGKNVATAFTNFCYSQFGPKAKYPDAGLLQKCLSK
ncbi:hypothetical protein [Hoeflea prorocentri]|uniref:Uncharacterized protein n=1 Tax=Hoeflea prorocentri TaxID=1922333 RepID=A0A9X3UMS4_9HYPH|nr:hypothetical protein [Hoeflea prorocentri]MCY6381936.1 hypothetical protein [Hoeflea prorocentri]MDA5399736.1 hypothetical protein [Hoeflea prorocentri]